MGKRTAAAIGCILAMALPMAVYAEEPPQTGGGFETSITISDITPREEKRDEAQGSLSAGGWYPAEVKTTEEDGVRLVIKTFVVPQDTSPQALVEEGLTRRGIEYRVSEILRRELEGEREQKTVSKTVTTEADTDQREELLALLEPSVEYHEEGFSGTLLLDRGSVRAEASELSDYAYSLEDTREYMGLVRSDPYYIPKTAEKNGAVLKLSDIRWTPMAGGADNSRFPSLYKATAVYSGTAWGSKAEQYLVTASYTGEVARTTQGDVAYSIVYEEVVAPAVIPKAFPWRTVLTGLFLAVLTVGVEAGIFLLARYLIQLLRSRQGERPLRVPSPDRPKMKLPEMLGEMDRGLEETE